jgi:hypothetical protein
MVAFESQVWRWVVTAQLIGPGAARLWTPDPARQRRANQTIEDVRALPDDAPRVELRDYGAGIAHYWWVEQDPVHVYVYELAAGPSYQIVADSDKELVLSRPFGIRLPIDSITP